MLWAIIAVLLILWLLGFIGGVGGSLIHLVLVIAAIVLVVQLLSGRRGALWRRRIATRKDGSMETPARTPGSMESGWSHRYKEGWLHGDPDPRDHHHRRAARARWGRLLVSRPTLIPIFACRSSRPLGSNPSRCLRVCVP